MTEEQVHAIKPGDKLVTSGQVVVVHGIMRSKDGRQAHMLAEYVTPPDPKLPILGLTLYTVIEDEDIINTNALAMEYVQ